jgi:hypothetical protein
MELIIRTKTVSDRNVYRWLATFSRQVVDRSRAIAKASPCTETSSEKAQTFRAWVRWFSEQENLRSNGFGGARSRFSEPTCRSEDLTGSCG